ncbi:MFS transporter [Proteiniphilum sp.]|uniref:MFS transporter n=1 Tax=Proteiniphilum sp. TaxID=1926877 RepID=UPI002B1F6C68|nr:MFS transporter [Proteiniphilum sp.]MEA4916865.1 MFS transporter [Proteiniphilum sp.]
MTNSYPVSKGKVLPVLFGFFIMGFCDLVGVSVTYAKDMFGWSETEAGFLPSMVFIWFLILSIPTAMLANKIGRKHTVMISMFFTFIGMVIPFFIFNEITCYLAFGFLGIGNTILQVSLNPLLTNVVYEDKLTSSLTAGQFIKAISSFLGPIVAGYCSLHLGSWEKMFSLYAIVTLISSAWLYFTRIEETPNEEKSLSFGRIIGLLGDGKILLLFLGILCIVGLDVGMNTVTPKLLIERTGIEKEAAGYGTSWYFAARTLGTFIGAFLLARVSAKGYFRINMLVVLIAMGALFIVSTQLWILAMVSIIAFAASSIFAVIYGIALQLYPQKANEISGLMITGVAGGAVIPPLMGISADYLGNQTGSLLIIGICVIYLFGCSFWVKTGTSSNRV